MKGELKDVELCKVSNGGGSLERTSCYVVYDSVVMNIQRFVRGWLYVGGAMEGREQEGR